MNLAYQEFMANLSLETRDMVEALAAFNERMNQQFMERKAAQAESEERCRLFTEQIRKAHR